MDLSLLPLIAQVEELAIDPGDTAWMLASTALVVLMTPALGLFYAGLVRSKNTLNTFMMCIAALAIVGITWPLIGYSLAFGEGNGFIGDLDFAALNGVGLEPREGDSIPHLLFMMFQGTFCILTAALVSGAIVERMRFGAYLFFIAIWSVLVYPVMAHWVFSPDGWLAIEGTLDFAGGVPVEMNSGFSALAAALVIGARRDYGRQAMLPHNSMFILLGAGLLWFGWFGFNGGSGLGANESSVLALTNTVLTPACTLAVWFLLDLARGGKITAVGAGTAVIVGCVGITPAAGFISPIWAMVLGALVALPCYAVIVWRPRTRVDETLDVLAAHGIAGIVGIVFIGFFAQIGWNGVANGLVYGDAGQLGSQLLAVLAAPAYAFAATYVILRLVGALMRSRATAAEQSVGMDISQHGEEAYVTGEGALLIELDAGGEPTEPPATEREPVAPG